MSTRMNLNNFLPKDLSIQNCDQNRKEFKRMLNQCLEFILVQYEKRVLRVVSPLAHEIRVRRNFKSDCILMPAVCMTIWILDRLCYLKNAQVTNCNARCVAPLAHEITVWLNQQPPCKITSLHLNVRFCF